MSDSNDPPVETDADRPPIRVGLVEDLPEVRDALCLLITGTPGFRCVGTFGSMEEALDGIPDPPPDVFLVDLGLPGMSGIEGIRSLRQNHPTIVVLALTVYGDDQRIFDALCAGASGYLLKKTPAARLLEGLREAVAGGAPMSPEVACRVLALFRDFGPPPQASYRLTPHEIRLLQLLSEGHQYKTAATAMSVTVSTISFHMQQIYRKLQVHSKSEAVAKALRNRLIR